MSIPFNRWFLVLAMAVTACGGGGSGDDDDTVDAAPAVDSTVADSAPDIDSEPPPPSGSLDDGFGTGGRVVTGVTNGNDDILDLAIDSNGAIVAVGEAGPDFLIARYTAAGVPDTQFSDDGIIVNDLGNAEHATSVLALSPGNEVLVAGHTIAAATSSGEILAYASGGQLQGGFGTGSGRADVMLGAWVNFARIIRLAGGELVCVGNTNAAVSSDGVVAKLSANGVLDDSFDADGLLTVDFGSVETITDGAVLSDGRIILVGSIDVGGTDYVLVVRLLADGNLDSDFNGEGWNSFDPGGGDDSATNVAIDAQGGVLVLWNGANDQERTAGVLRVGEDGVLDDDFGSAGIVTFDYGTPTFAGAMALDAGGKILAASGVVVGEDMHVGLTRLETDGSTDTSFGDGGTVVVPLGVNPADTDFPNALVVQPDGRIVVGGRGGSSSGNRDAALIRLWP